MIEMLIALTLTLSSTQTATGAQLLSKEQQAWCRMFTCTPDALTFRIKEKKAGNVTYFPIEGGVYRPGGRPVGSLQHLAYDEVWIEWVFADMDFDNRLSQRDRLADISYAYWKGGAFVLSLTFAAADPRYVPRNLTERGREPSQLERFLYQRMNGIGPATTMKIPAGVRAAVGIEEWFVVDRIMDRTWFETEAATLK